ncbi:unknown [Acidiphilium sp. CAG:727]|nr:unknown [Acidiphilium sp. CAG:727]
MRFIFYTYSDTGIITIDYDDGYTQKKNRYVGYSLRDAIKKIRQDNGLTGKYIKVIKLY